VKNDVRIADLTRRSSAGKFEKLLRSDLLAVVVGGGTALD
jgi:hypothetical protein